MKTDYYVYLLEATRQTFSTMALLAMFYGLFLRGSFPDGKTITVITGKQIPPADLERFHLVPLE